jgi:hypothetical protein
VIFGGRSLLQKQPSKLVKDENRESSVQAAFKVGRDLFGLSKHPITLVHQNNFFQHF